MCTNLLSSAALCKCHQSVSLTVSMVIMGILTLFSETLLIDSILNFPNEGQVCEKTCERCPFPINERWEWSDQVCSSEVSLPALFFRLWHCQQDPFVLTKEPLVTSLP